KYIATFTSIDKAQSSMQKIFHSRVFGRAGKGRSCFAGRFTHRGAVNQTRGSTSYQQEFKPQFYPQRNCSDMATDPEGFKTQVRDHTSGPLLVGERIVLFLTNWQMLTTYPWVLQTVSGYCIELYSTPIQHCHPKPLVFSKEQEELLSQGIHSLILKQVIEICSSHPSGFVSTLFLVQKKNKK
ncbi:hypothetical protein NDU88_002127, partial [Pleurodeles waltl]